VLDLELAIGVRIWASLGVGPLIVVERSSMTSNRATATLGPAIQRTRWGHVALLLAAGIGAAMQVGKVPAALATLQRELRLTLIAAAWVISMFSVVGSVLGFLAGAVADHLGARRSAALGLAGMALAGMLGAGAHGGSFLLASRALEGLGFVLVVVAIPDQLLASAAERDRRFVSALWGTYMPIGTAIALVLAPALVATHGWRFLWQTNAALLVLLAAGLALAPLPTLAQRRGIPTRALLRTALLHRGPLLLGLIFACYTVQYLSILGFLPIILAQQGISAQSAGNLTAFAVLANALGNLTASALAARGVPARRLIAFACVVMGCASLGIYSPYLNASAHYLLVVILFGFGGLIPASIFASVPAVTPHKGSTATTMGFVVQASHLGQLIGPPSVAAVASAVGGWQLSAVVLVPAALAALAAALSLRASH
jgi:MFS family permease